MAKTVRGQRCRLLSRVLAVAVGLALGFAQPVDAKVAREAAAKAPAAARSRVSPTWYALALGQLQGRLAVAHYWSYGTKFRALTLISGKPILTIVNGRFYYTIDLAERVGVRIERNPRAIAVDGRYARPFAEEWEELMAAGGEKVKEETVAGRVAEVWRLTNNSGRRTVWVSRERPMVPMRVQTFDRKTGRDDSVDYVNWQLGLPIPEQFFDPPEGIEMETFDYEGYIAAVRRGPVGPAPPLYRHLLHGNRHEDR